MRTRIVALAASLLFLGAACGGGTPASAQASSSDGAAAPPSITAQGVGRVTGVPDVLTVSFDVHTDGDSANQTLQDNSAAAAGHRRSQGPRCR
ncbi:MAG: hypothetical protein QOE63_150 [Acidimicrobiaceae bacterium]|jgi:uncharacterized protein YggE